MRRYYIAEVIEMEIVEIENPISGTINRRLFYEWAYVQEPLYPQLK